MFFFDQNAFGYRWPALVYSSVVAVNVLSIDRPDRMLLYDEALSYSEELGSKAQTCKRKSSQCYLNMNKKAVRSQGNRVLSFSMSKMSVYSTKLYSLFVYIRHLYV